MTSCFNMAISRLLKGRRSSNFRPRVTSGDSRGRLLSVFHQVGLRRHSRTISVLQVFLSAGWLSGQISSGDVLRFSLFIGSGSRFSLFFIMLRGGWSKRVKGVRRLFVREDWCILTGLGWIIRQARRGTRSHHGKAQRYLVHHSGIRG